jgi:hypothetical protein
VHPRARIVALHAPVRIGAGCIVSERSVVGLLQQPQPEPPGPPDPQLQPQPQPQPPKTRPLAKDGRTGGREEDEGEDDEGDEEGEREEEEEEEEEEEQTCVQLDDGVVVEIGARVEARRVGAGSHVGVNAHVGRGAVVGQVSSLFFYLFFLKGGKTERNWFFFSL